MSEVERFDLVTNSERHREELKADPDGVYAYYSDLAREQLERSDAEERADKAEAQRDAALTALKELAAEFEDRANAQFEPEGMKRLRKAIYECAALAVRKRIADLKGEGDG